MSIKKWVTDGGKKLTYLAMGGQIDDATLAAAPK
jgi:hypothetical protein